MSFLIWTSIISLGIIAIMLSVRYYEIKSQSEIISSRLKVKMDEKVTSFLARTYRVYRRIYQKIGFHLHNFSNAVNDKLHFAWRKLSDKVDEYFMKIKGRRGDGKRGSISIYWKKIDEIRGDKIE